MQGAMTGGSHGFSIRVYYEDTDFSGNVYHAAYLKFFERARTEFLRAEGIQHSELATQGVALAVRSLSIEFVAAAHIDDLLDIETVAVGASGARLTLRQTASRTGKELATASVVVVAIRQDGRPARLPKAVLKLFGLRA